MSAAPPIWRAEEAADFEDRMSAKAAQLLREITSNFDFRQAVLREPKVLHEELFREFVPVGYPIYAGTFRGTPKTSLENRRFIAKSLYEKGVEYEFCAPDDVTPQMAALMAEVRGFVSCRELDDDSKLLALSYIFCRIGRIAPFLDGNGHFQRSIFAAMASEFGIELAPHFSIHPAPYGRLMAIALEMFSRAENGDEVLAIPLVAEYLRFFLAAPFNIQAYGLVTK